MSGDDDMTFPMMSNPKIGAAGVISVTSNMAPGMVSQMIAAALDGDIEGAREIEKKLKPLLTMVTVKVDSERTLPNGRTVRVQDRFRNPIAVKAAMSVLGMPSGPCRKPLGKLTPQAAAVIRENLSSVYSDNPEVLAPIGDFYNVDIERNLRDDGLWQRLVYTD
jgi:4-hydroxy-tetrahydrodipicolinate synthase